VTRQLTLEVVDSTNSEAGRLLAAGNRGPLWIMARSQQAGRGRHGRDWASPPGNLHATLLTTLAVPLAHAAQLSFVAGLAMRDTVSTLLEPARPPIGLKWPNDVLIAGRKVSGILVETLNVASDGGVAIAIGCGLNILHAPAATRLPATCLADHGAAPTADLAMAELMARMEARLAQWQAGYGFAETRDAWLAAAVGIGRDVAVMLDGVAVEGRFEGLGRDGAMMLRLADGTLRQLHAGEVAFASPDRAPA
jgi:BirA family transcriptional regulator, biotin operon repressor / biotin---[acetyl-CoA-carboxylase] ligase